MSPPRREPSRLIGAAALTLAGAGGAASVAALSLAAQRVAFPFAALFVGAGEVRAAFAVIGASAAASAVRTMANESIAARVRTNVFDAFAGAARAVPAPLAETAEVVSPRFAVCMPELVAWAQGGVVVAAAGVLSAPIAIGLLLREVGARLVAPMLLGAVVVAAGVALASPRVASAWQVAWERSRAVQSRFFELHQGLVELRAQGELAPFEASLRAELERFSRDDARARRLQSLFTWGVAVIALGAGAVGAATLAPDALPAGDGVARGALFVIATLPSLVSLVSGMARLTAARSELATVADLARPAIPPTVDASFDPSAELRLDQIGFTYPPADGRSPRKVLADFSLTLPAGKSVAVVGSNGSGKTTLLHLLVGVLAPDAGRILLDGKPARLDDARWHARIAFVSQRPLEIREASIAANVRLFAPAAEDAAIESALRQLGVWPALRARTSSDAAVLGLALGSLSRGEARRVALARAFVREAALVVLDEPEANLDVTARVEVLAALRELKKSVRVVVAVHDRALTAFADEVIELGPASEDAS